MNQFAQFILSKLQSSMMLIVLAVPLIVTCFLAIYLYCRKKGKQFPWKKTVLWTLLTGYLLALVYVTLFRGLFMGRFVNLHLFRAWREAWNNYSVKNWLNVLLNVAMFVPLGVLLPLISMKVRKWYISIGIAFVLSVTIELLQLLRGIGICDIDDLFANTLGAVIGYAATIFVLTITRKGKIDWKRCLCSLVALVLTVGSIFGIFITYGLKEYGNIPNTSSFKVNTGKVNWELSCALPVEREVMPVYYTKTYSKADCNALALEFTQIFGISFDDIQYYDEEAYFMDHGSNNGYHFLTISYLDGSFDYHSGTREEVFWADTDRETMIAALADFPLTIPGEAKFSVDGDGWHSFSVDCLVLDDTMYDGTIRCRYGTDGRIYVVENHLISYKPYSQAETITPQKAYDRLCNGQFSDGDYFERKAPKDIQVVGAAMEYRVDTKGFYRPVYVFELVATDCRYQASVMVRAD